MVCDLLVFAYLVYLIVTNTNCFSAHVQFSNKDMVTGFQALMELLEGGGSQSCFPEGHAQSLPHYPEAGCIDVVFSSISYSWEDLPQGQLTHCCQ
jgi:hypothetical protein